MYSSGPGLQVFWDWLLASFAIISWILNVISDICDNIKCWKCVQYILLVFTDKKRYKATLSQPIFPYTRFVILNDVQSIEQVTLVCLVFWAYQTSNITKKIKLKFHIFIHVSRWKMIAVKKQNLRTRKKIRFFELPQIHYSSYFSNKLIQVCTSFTAQTKSLEIFQLVI